MVLDSHRWVPLPAVGFSANSVGDDSQEDVTPPSYLMEHPPLAVFINGKFNICFLAGCHFRTDCSSPSIDSFLPVNLGGCNMPTLNYQLVASYEVELFRLKVSSPWAHGGGLGRFDGKNLQIVT